MKCRECGSHRVEWKGPLIALTHTECAACGARDCHEPDECETHNSVKQSDLCEAARAIVLRASLAKRAGFTATAGITSDQIDALERALAAQAPLRARIETLEAALRGMVGGAYPVATEINPRGYNWCEAYLDQALPAARDALDEETEE